MNVTCLPERLLQSAADLERYLLEQRSPALADLDLPDDFVVPCHGISSANVPATLAEVLGGRLLGAAGPLPDALWSDLAEDVRRVVWIILDAVGWLHLQRLLTEEADLSLARLAQAGRFVPITAVFPSNTTSALTTLWTGYMPAQHGLLGHIMYLREFGVMADMLMFSPVGGPGRDQMLERGLVLEEFLPVPGLGEALAEQGITTRALINRELAATAFSRVSFRGLAQVDRSVSTADMCVRMRQMLSAHVDERLLLAAYLAEVDSIGHIAGPNSEAWRAELRSLAFSLEREFLGQLTPRERQGTLLLLTSDHGQVPEFGVSVPLADHPGLYEHLLLPATGSLRSAYLYACQGEVEEAEGYLRDHLPEQFAVLDSEAALQAGLWGGGRPTPQVRDRIGDLVVMARGNHLLDYRRRERRPLGMHGGSSRWEMLVPLLMARLD